MKIKIGRSPHLQFFIIPWRYKRQLMKGKQEFMIFIWLWFYIEIRIKC